MDHAAWVSISFIFSKQSVVAAKIITESKVKEMPVGVTDGSVWIVCVKHIQASTGLDLHHRLHGVPRNKRKENSVSTFK